MFPNGTIVEAYDHLFLGKDSILHYTFFPDGRKEPQQVRAGTDEKKYQGDRDGAFAI